MKKAKVSSKNPVARKPRPRGPTEDYRPKSVQKAFDVCAGVLSELTGREQRKVKKLIDEFCKGEP